VRTEPAAPRDVRHDCVAELAYSKITASDRPSQVEWGARDATIDKIAEPPGSGLRLGSAPVQEHVVEKPAGNLAYEVERFVRLVAAGRTRPRPATHPHDSAHDGEDRTAADRSVTPRSCDGPRSGQARRSPIGRRQSHQAATAETASPTGNAHQVPWCRRWRGQGAREADHEAVPTYKTKDGRA